MNKVNSKKFYLKIYYSMTQWRWYTDANTFRVFMHMLLTANRKDHYYLKNCIHEGETLLSTEEIAKSLKLSIQQVRTAISHLKSTGEITSRILNGVTVYRITRYIDYQSGNIAYEVDSNSEATTKQQPDNNQSTTLRECNSENNEESVRVPGTHAHGNFKNVILKDEDFADFMNTYPDNGMKLINELSEKLRSGMIKNPKEHIFHLYAFAHNKNKPDTSRTQDREPSYDIGLAMAKARNVDPTKTKRVR